MSRRSGACRRVLGLAVAAAWAGGALALGFTGTAASAAGVSYAAALTTHGLSSSAGSGSIVRINQGDSVIFSRGPRPSGVPDATYTAQLDARSVSDGFVTLSYGAPTHSVTFLRSGSFAFNWTFYNLLIPMPVTNGEYTSATIVVTAPASSPPPASPAGSSPAGSPRAGSPAGSSPVPVAGGLAGSLVQLVPAPNSSIHGFAAPPPDTASGAATSAGLHTSGAPPSGSASTDGSGATTPGPVSMTTLYADVAIVKPRPVGLAVICILALAAVTGAYAYKRLGASALGSARRR